MKADPEHNINARKEVSIDSVLQETHGPRLCRAVATDA